MENSDIFSIVSKLLGINFKTQYYNSEIEFKDIFIIESLVNQEKSYLLALDDKAIIFRDTKDFIAKFTKHIDQLLEKLDSEFKELEYHQKTDLTIDKNYIFLIHESIGDKESKLSQLKNRLNKISKK